MKFLGLLKICLVAGLVAAKPTSDDQESQKDTNLMYFTRAFSAPNQSGFYKDLYDYVPNLFNYGLDNDIESVYQTGMWMYYENTNYNAGKGRMYFVHGIEILANFPSNVANIASSLRFAGNKYVHNDDTWTLYDGQYFTGNEFYGVTDAATLEYLDLAASSVIVTGKSAWTLFSGRGWTGDRICVYPKTDHDVGARGQQLDFGIYPTMASLGIGDNTVRSVKRGCWSHKVAPTTPNVKYEERSENGGWGYADL